MLSEILLENQQIIDQQASQLHEKDDLLHEKDDLLHKKDDLLHEKDFQGSLIG